MVSICVYDTYDTCILHTHHSALVGWKLNCKNYYWNKTAYKKSHSECKCILWKWFERHPMSKKPTTVSITIYNAMATKKRTGEKNTVHIILVSAAWKINQIDVCACKSTLCNNCIVPKKDFVMYNIKRPKIIWRNHWNRTHTTIYRVAKRQRAIE